MKFNIQKLQEGGYAAPWVQYNPFFGNIGQESETPTSASGSKSEDKIKTQLASTLDKLVGKGLNNEVNDFAQQIGALLSNSELMGTPISVREYSSIVAQLNEIQNNKAIFDEAKKHALENGTLSEATITFDGRLYTQNREGKIMLLTPDQYSEDRENYRVLTNSELLVMRNTSPALLYDQTVSQTVGGSLSVQDISKFIDEAIKMIQKEDSSSDMYINKTRANQFSEGLKTLVQSKMGMAPDNQSYKLTTSTSTQRNHLNTALNRIWEKLPQHAKNTLIAHSALNGSDNPRQEAVKAIGDILVYGTYHGEEIKISDEGELLSDGSKRSSGAGGGKTTEINPLDIYAGFEKNHRYTVKFGSELQYTTNAMIAPLVGIDKTLQNNKYLSNIITEGGLGALLDPNGASLGTGGTLSEADLSKIIYGSEQVAIAWLPAKFVNGHKVVDLEKLQDLEKANQEIEEKGNSITQMEKDEIDKRYGVSHLRIEGQPNASQMQHFAQFMIIPSYIPQKVADKYNLSRYIQEVDKDTRKELYELYEHIRSGGENKDVRSSSYVPDDGLFNTDEIYKTSVFIPLQDNIVFRSVVGGNSPTMSSSRLDRSVFEYNQKSSLTGPRINTKGSFGLNK